MIICLLWLAQLQLSPPPPAASGASGSIDPAAATRAYLDLILKAEREKSDAYFEGGYWLQLWGFLWSAGIFVLLLQTGASRRKRDRAERRTRYKPLQTAFFSVDFLVAASGRSLPPRVDRVFV